LSIYANVQLQIHMRMQDNLGLRDEFSFPLRAFDFKSVISVISVE
jgi:hypothetical protein